MNITVPLTIPFQRVADVMCGAIEGGSGYWCSGFHRETGPDLPDFYAEAAFYESGNYSIKVTHDDPDEDEGVTKITLIGPAEVEEGLRLLAEKVPHQFSNLLSENDDAATSDCLLQCIVLKDVIFG